MLGGRHVRWLWADWENFVGSYRMNFVLVQRSNKNAWFLVRGHEILGDYADLFVIVDDGAYGVSGFEVMKRLSGDCEFSL